jgi:hypothetical protein
VKSGPTIVAVPLFGPWLRPMEDWKILLEGESLGLRQEIQLSFHLSALAAIGRESESLDTDELARWALAAHKRR